MQYSKQVSISKKVDSHIQMANPPTEIQGIKSDILSMRYDPTGS